MEARIDGRTCSRGREILGRLGVASEAFQRGEAESRSPITGESIGRPQFDDADRRPPPRRGGRRVSRLAKSSGAEPRRLCPPARRGIARRQAGTGAARYTRSGKISSESLGEVQEMIDICDFAVGLSRQLYGLTIATEREGHRMMETWHPRELWGSSPASIFLSRYGPGTRRSRWFAATVSSGSRRKRPR